MNSQKPLKEFYNYKYWRETQRQQLTIASNIYFALSSTIIGFTVKLLLKKEDYIIECCELVFLTLGIILSILSLSLYVCLVNNKLKDYRETARLIKSKKKYEEISEKTLDLGIKTWDCFKYQKLFMIAGFILCAIGYGILIFK